MKPPLVHRSIFSVLWLALAIACVAFWATPSMAYATEATETKVTLQTSLDTMARQAKPGLFGIAVLDLQSGVEWRVNADHAYPMMSVFKAPVAAAVLSLIDDGSLSLQQKVILSRADVQDGSAVPSIGAHFHGERMAFTVDQLLTAAISESDSTAADALVKLVGGPGAVTAYLRKHGIEGMRVDMDEAGIARLFANLPPGEKPPGDETPQQAWQRRQHGYAAFLADPRNRSTPDAAVSFLRKLWSNELLSKASTQRLIRLMELQTIPNRIRAGLPAGVRWADKCGTADSSGGETAAYNDIGILTGPDGHVVIITAFLTDSHASKEVQDGMFAQLGRAVAAALYP
ncbi:MAG: class A beta-lactamase [Rhodanobacter sp.]